MKERNAGVGRVSAHTGVGTDFAMVTSMGMQRSGNVFQLVVAKAAPSGVVFLVQSRAGNLEFVLSPERLTRGGVVFVTQAPLGQVHERLLIDICLEGGASSDAIDIVASIDGHIEGVGTRVRFRWAESNPASEARMNAFIDKHSVVKPGSDYPLTSFAMAA
jgi:hypothetical protein